MIEAEPGTRYFARQIERHGGWVVRSCEGHAPDWRFYVSFAGPISTARRILQAGHFDVRFLGGTWTDEDGVEFPCWAIMLPDREPSESELHTELAQAAEDWERWLGYLSTQIAIRSPCNLCNRGVAHERTTVLAARAHPQPKRLPSAAAVSSACVSAGAIKA